MYFIVINIPAIFHSKDLRNYFSFLTEQNAFECFHYYHRKTDSFLKYLQESKQIFLNNSSEDYIEILGLITKEFNNLNRHNSEALDLDLPDNENGQLGLHENYELNFVDADLKSVSIKENVNILEVNLGNCSFVKVKNEFSKEFKSLYHKKCWVAFTGEVFPSRCLVFNIDSLVLAHKAHEVSEGNQVSNCKYFAKFKKLNLSKIEQLKDFQMGLELPCGNVGTSGEFLKAQLQLCKLSSSVIKKLGLDFQPKMTKKCHNQVHLEYGTAVMPSSNFSSNMLFTNSGDLIPGYFDVKFNKKLDKVSTKSTFPIIEAKTDSGSDEADEKWDKYDEVYEDIRHKEMSKDKLFESEIEQVWEKGGSGLVFWTDAQFWRMEDNESEESDADDWDLTGDNYADEKDKAFINFIQDIKLNPISHSVFTNDKNAIKKMNRYVHLMKKMSAAEMANQTGRVKALKQQVNEVSGLGKLFPNNVRKKLRKIAELELKKKSVTNSSKYIKKNRDGSGPQIVNGNHKQKGYEKKNKIFNEYGEFERYSKGIGSRILKSQGWQEGEGLGKYGSGIVQPVNIFNIAKQHKKREGIGFHFPKLSKREKKKKKSNPSTSNQLPEESEVTIEKNSKPAGSHSCLTPKISKLNITTSENLKVKEHELINADSLKSFIDSSFNSKTSSTPKTLDGFNIYPHVIKFQKASLET